jgi:hypothetical protein
MPRGEVMKSENNGICHYKGCSYILKYGHSKDSARILLEAMDRSGHLSESLFYKMSKLMSGQGIDVYDAIGMSNEMICKISRISGVGSACIDVLCELQQAGTQQKSELCELQQAGTQQKSEKSVTELLLDTYAEISETNKENKTMKEGPFTPKPVCELVHMELEEEIEAGEQKDMTVTYGDICIKFHPKSNDVAIRVSDGTIIIEGA